MAADIGTQQFHMRNWLSRKMGAAIIGTLCVKAHNL